MGQLTTHILDLTQGKPAANIRIDVCALSGSSFKQLKTAATNIEGRLDAPLLSPEEMRPRTYELLFHIGDYFRGCGMPQGRPPFLDIVAVRFNIAESAENYHVPLLISPWGYQVYRGS